MALDVHTEIIIDQPVDVVSNYAADPTNAPEWYENIKAVNWKTSPPLTIGSQVDFVAQFMGKRLEYTYEMIDVVPGNRLTQRTVQGPFPMETTYTWTAVDAHSTRMTLRNRGEPAGFSKLAAPFMAIAVKRANRKDLAKLKHLLETRAQRA
jgi:uncharacterized membrane protein